MYKGLTVLLYKSQRKIALDGQREKNFEIKLDFNFLDLSDMLRVNGDRLRLIADK